MSRPTLRTSPFRSMINRANRRIVVLPLLAASIAAMPASAFGAPAGNVEVISRAWGAQGAAPFSLGKWGGSNRPLIAGAVSDNGRYAAFSWARKESTSNFPFTDNDAPIYLRDVQRNETIEVSSTAYNEATAFDRSGRYLSYLSGPVGETGLDTSLYVYDIQTKRKTLVSRATGATGAVVSSVRGLVSGDGRSAVFSTPGGHGLPAGIYRRDLTTNVTTRLGDRPERQDGYDFVQITSVSDDGRTIGATNFNWGDAAEGVVLSPGRSDVIPGHPQVSADGTTAAYLADGPGSTGAELWALNPATGQRTKLGRPERNPGLIRSTASIVVSWVSPNGKEIVVTNRRETQTPQFGGDFVAQLFDRATGAFRDAGPYATDYTRHASPYLFGGVSTFSRNGRFAVIPSLGPGSFNVGPEPRALLLVDTHGWNGIPGGADLPSPNLYVERRGPWCEFAKPGVVMNVKSLLAPRHLPKASSVRGVFRAGGEVVFDATVSGTDQEGIVRLPQGTRSFTGEITVTIPGRGTAMDTYTFDVDPTVVCDG